MQRLERGDMLLMTRKRRNLREFFLQETVEAYLLTDLPIGLHSQFWGEESPIMLVKTKQGRLYLVQSVIGEDGRDRVNTWLQDDLFDRFVVVDKVKLGRKPRELTNEEQQKILELRAGGMSINGIAKALKVGNRRVMDFLKGGGGSE